MAPARPGTPLPATAPQRPPSIAPAGNGPVTGSAAPQTPSTTGSRPFMPIVTAPGGRPNAPRPASAPPAPLRPSTPVIAPAVLASVAPAIAPRPVMPVIAAAVPAPLVPQVAPRPAMPTIAPPVARPVLTTPTLAPAARPSTSNPAVIAPAAPPVARPAASTILIPPAPPQRSSSSLSPVLVPPAPPQAGARSSPSTVIAPPAPAAAPRPTTGPQAAAVRARPSPLPTSGAIEGISDAQAAELRALAVALSTIDYFEALGVPQGANSGEIKKAFYRESRTYHPDRFFHLPDSEVKTDIGSIYKRITEAYYVLRDDVKRKKYAADIASTERTTKLRYTDATESEIKAEARKTVEEEFGTNPKSRPFFKTAMAEFDKQNWAAALQNFKMGLTYEPGNTRFKEKLVETQKQIEDQRRVQGPSFLIK